MSDAFQYHSEGLESPATRLASVTPHDTNPLPFATRAFSVAAAGNVRVTTVRGDTGTVFVAAGVPFALRVTHILATGTTATGIVALA